MIVGHVNGLMGSLMWDPCECINPLDSLLFPIL